MSSDYIASKVINSFQDFCLDTPPEKLNERLHKTLMDYIEAWVQYGDGIRICVGDFQTYLVGVIAIIEAWVMDPSILDYVTDDDEQRTVERRVASISGDDATKSWPWTLDEAWFAQQVFAHLHEPRRS